MPAVRAVDGGLCAVGAGGEVARGVGRCGSAIYGKENDMRPKRYPYSGQMKKQPHDEIAKLRCEVAVNTSELNSIKRKLSSN
ncbi:TPA: hypothetical protein ACGOV5_001539 [Streptococcus suis]